MVLIAVGGITGVSGRSEGTQLTGADVSTQSFGPRRRSG
jgi:hypothetical protein